jgi:hypothetical protein
MKLKTNCGLRLRQTALQQEQQSEHGEIDLLGYRSHIIFFMSSNKPGTRISASNRIVEVTCKRCKKERAKPL